MRSDPAVLFGLDQRAAAHQQIADPILNSDYGLHLKVALAIWSICHNRKAPFAGEARKVNLNFVTESPYSATVEREAEDQTMTVIELSDEQAATLVAQGQARGLTVAQWVSELAAQHASLAAPPLRTAAEIVLRRMSDLSPEDEAMPPDGASQHDHYLYGSPKR